MKALDRTRWCAAAVAWAMALGLFHAPCRAQFGGAMLSTEFELAPTVDVDRADAGTLAQLERARAYLASRQWDEAIEALRQVSETAENKLLAVSERRYVSLRDYCQLQLAALPPEALKLYRTRVDPLARTWYEDGLKRRDRRLLANVVDQALASSYGDEALMALGELAFEEGDFTSARWCWERIVPAKLPEGAPPTWPGYPDTNLDLAAVRARLVLVSIVEGSLRRAADELDQFRRQHAEARGRLGGREVTYADALAALLAEGRAWPRPRPSADWPTFAGAADRNKTAPAAPDPAGVLWRAPLPDALDAALAGQRAGDRPGFGPSAYPVVVGDLVLAASERQIVALRASDGRPAWGRRDGTIYEEKLPAGLGRATSHEMVGVPQFTLTIDGSRLYARMGMPATGRPLERLGSTGHGYLVCLDLAAQGRLQWKIEPDEGWAFDGTPVFHQGSVLVAMRRHDVRPQAHVASFDAETGRLQWRRFVCAADTPARGMLYETTHNLLTLEHDTVFFNTNLGAVAALRARDGQMLWLSLYPRATKGDVARLAGHWRRDPSPAVVARGVVYVAPADSERIFAYDAAGGQLLWASSPELNDVTHLLGVVGDWLLAGGGRLYWISTQGEDQGRARHFWPDGREHLGHGRGVLAGGAVFWPTREKIYVFDVQTAESRRVIDLSPRKAAGGNLLVAGGRLLIATAEELIALSNTPDRRPDAGEPLTMSRVGTAHQDTTDDERSAAAGG